MPQKSSLPRQDYLRFIKAADELRGWKSAAEIARNLTTLGYSISDQVITNWRTRGVSKDGMIKAAPIIGFRPHWLETGEGEMRDGYEFSGGAVARFCKEPDKVYDITPISEVVRLMNSVDHETQLKMLGGVQMLEAEFRNNAPNSKQRAG